MTVNQKLKTLREESGLSQQDVADALHTGQTAISNFENGKSRLDVEMLLKFAEFYNVEPQQLLTDNNLSIIFNDKVDNGSAGYIQIQNTESKDLLETLKEQLAIKDKQIEHLLSIIYYR
jgi:transcriptional regulator with XRE-family HTH domain